MIQASRSYFVLFGVGIALLAIGVVAGFVYSIRSEKRLPPPAVYSVGASQIEELIAKEHYEQAIEELRLMLRMMPTDHEMIHNMLGQALEKRGDLDEAVEHFRSALEIDPRFAEAHNNLGVALAKQGSLADAVAEVREALRLNPELTGARRNLQLMQTRLAERGAGPTGDVPPEMTRARAFLALFYRGDLEAMHARFSSEFAERMSLEALDEMWRSAAARLGPEVETLDERLGSTDDSTLYVRRARFEKHDGEIEVVIELTADGSLTGFVIRPVGG
jgi:tetratricopeptide (TPR) repeat protein